MAFYSLKKWFSTFRKSKYPDMIYIYSEYYCKTEADRVMEKIKRQQQADLSLAMLKSMARIIGDFYYKCNYMKMKDEWSRY